MPDAKSPLEHAAAIKTCLEYLQDEARRTGLEFTASLIATAALSLDDSLSIYRAEAALEGRKVGNLAN